MDMKELDRRIKKGVRNIQISPLFEIGKRYNIDSNSKNYQKEDENGTLVPERNHCWLTWESKWLDEEEKEHWSKEAYNFNTTEEAKVAKTYLNKFLI